MGAVRLFDKTMKRVYHSSDLSRTISETGVKGHANCQDRKEQMETDENESISRGRYCSKQFSNCPTTRNYANSSHVCSWHACISRNECFVQSKKKKEKRRKNNRWKRVLPWKIKHVPYASVSQEIRFSGHCAKCTFFQFSCFLFVFFFLLASLVWHISFVLLRWNRER